MFNIVSLFFLLIASSLDNLIAGFSIGMEKIKISYLSIIFLSLVGSIFLMISCLFGEQISCFVPNHYISFLSTCFFFILGIQKILKAFLPQKEEQTDSINTSNMKCILCIYHNPKTVDLDHSKTLSIKELLFLTIALSFDNFTIGIVLGTQFYSLFLFIIFHFFISFFLFFLGNRISYSRLKTHSKMITCLSGILFLLVGIYRILY